MNKEEQEKKWISEAKKNPDAFKYLFDKYFQQVYNYVLRRTANPVLTQDITAGTFLKAFENIDRFKWKGIPFSAWLFRIAVNEINQEYRKTKRITTMADNGWEAMDLKSDKQADSDILALEAEIQKNKSYKKVNKALKQIKPMYASALTLRYFENLSIKEIADILGLTENTVKTHIRRGLQKLRELL